MVAAVKTDLRDKFPDCYMGFRAKVIAGNVKA